MIISILLLWNLFLWSSFPEHCSDDGNPRKARALNAATLNGVGDIGLRDIPEVSTLSQDWHRLRRRHDKVSATKFGPTQHTSCSCLPHAQALRLVDEMQRPHLFFSTQDANSWSNMWHSMNTVRSTSKLASACIIHEYKGWAKCGY